MIDIKLPGAPEEEKSETVTENVTLVPEKAPEPAVIEVNFPVQEKVEEPTEPAAVTTAKRGRPAGSKNTGKVVSVDFSAPGIMKNPTVVQEKAEKRIEVIQKPSIILPAGCPFKPADDLPRRVKMLIYGPPGVGKTTFALKFPDPVLVDIDRGADHYGKLVKFHVDRECKDWTTLQERTEWLMRNRHPFKTCIIDPISIGWDMAQEYWNEIFLKRNKGGKGFKFEFYDNQLKDWKTVTASWRAWMWRLKIQLDMNIILIARDKEKFIKKGDEFAISGNTFQGQKDLGFDVDTVLRMFFDDKGNRWGVVVDSKDRTHRLPREPFPMDDDLGYEAFKGFFGEESLTREVKTLNFANDQQKSRLTELFSALGATNEQMISTLRSKHDAESLDDLTAEEAVKAIAKLTEIIVAKNNGAKTNANVNGAQEKQTA